MDQVSTLDPAANIMTYGGTPIDGFGDSQWKLSKAEDDFSEKAGSTGEVARMVNRNNIHYLDVELLQSAKSNEYFSTSRATDRAFGTGTKHLLIRDTMGTTVIDCANCYVKKLPDAERANEVKTNTWRIVLPNPKVFLGSSNVNVDS
jgi:hypothetical protein